MAILYKLFQDKRESQPTFGKWFAQTVRPQQVDLEWISQKIQDNTSVKRADVWAVLIELVEVMSQCLHEGWVVNIDRLGVFRVYLNSKGADSREAFDERKNITGAHVRFMPKMVWYGSHKGSHRNHKLIDGFDVKEIPF